MKVGVNHWIWLAPFKSSEHLGLISKVKTIGAEVLEFDFEDDAEFDTAAIRRALRDHALEASMIALMGPDRDLSSDDEQARRNGLAYAKRGIDTTAALGGSLFTGSVCGVAGDKMLSEAELTSRLQRTAEYVEQLGRHAADAGIRFSVEVLNRYENNILHSVENGLRLVELVAHPSVGLHLDCFHMSMEEPSLANAIRSAGDKLFHLHSSESHRGTPGTGLIQWDEVATALRDINYRGYCVIESFNPDVKACWITELAKMWRPRAESPDMLAKNGIAFLQSTFRA